MGYVFSSYTVCFDWENNCSLSTLSYYHHQTWKLNHMPLLGHKTMVCAVCLVICSYDVSIWLDCFVGHFVSWHFYLESGPMSLTCNITHYLAGFPTDYWHLANLFSSVCFYVSVCLRWLYHHIPLTYSPGITDQLAFISTATLQSVMCDT